MKKVILFLITAAVLAFGTGAQAAQRLVSFDVSSASSAEGTGFLFGVMPDNGGARIVYEEEDVAALCLYNGAEADSSDVVVAYNASWSGESVDHLVMTTRIKTDEISDSSTQKFISFRMKSSPHALVCQIRENRFYCNNTVVPNLTVETGRWYDVQVALRQNPTPSIVLYIDGAKVSTVPFSNLSKITSAGLQYRMEITGPGTFYIGDTNLYIPDEPTAVPEKEQLTSSDEPVILNFGTSEIDTDTLKDENIRVIDNINGETVECNVTPLNGNRVQLDFPNGLRDDDSYTVEFDGVLDISGQKLAPTGFKTPVPENVYDIGELRYYSGFDVQNEITSLKEGNITVCLELSNKGLQERQAAFVCVLYQDNKLAGVSVAGTTLAALEQSELVTSINVPSVSAGTKLYTMLWRGFGGSPITSAQILTRQGVE